MTKNKVSSLCEAVADIAYIAAKENYRTDDSRAMISQFIEWAYEFEYLHKRIEWGINSPIDYIESIHYFTIFKIQQWRNI
ncbi:MAG: hypothetical protein JO072_08410 [Parafilimonas sp.]|nr:hypothetical protein [Parafilimonas sp.]